LRGLTFANSAAPEGTMLSQLAAVKGASRQIPHYIVLLSLPARSAGPSSARRWPES